MKCVPISIFQGVMHVYIIYEQPFLLLPPPLPPS